MKSTLKCLAVLATVVTCYSISVFSADVPDATTAAASFKGKLGLQLYSLRNQFAKDVPGTLDEVRGFGIQYAELAGNYNQTPEAFKQLMVDRGITPISGHFGYERFRDDPEGVAKEAKALGLKYAGCAWVPHKGDFDEAAVHDTAKVFNHAGEVLKKEGIQFFHHTHGFEFLPYQGGTMFDLLIKETDARNVGFEMDIFWVQFAGQDPVSLLKKYPTRWKLMHLKDMNKSLKTGSSVGGTSPTNDVTIGTGQMDIPGILAAAKHAGVEYYFIEDESPVAETQIPQSIKFLRAVKF